MQLDTFLESSAQRSPDKTALICGRDRPTYAELETKANRLAHALIELGIERGDRVAVCLENSIEAVLALFATLKAGAVFMPINPATKPDKLGYLLNNSRARALVMPACQIPALQTLWHASPHLTEVIVTGDLASTADRKRTSRFDELIERHAADRQPPAKRAINIDLAALIYTSGSTGNPKGVMLTHLNMTSAATSITTYLENRPDDVIINVLPMSFDYGLYQAIMAVQIGGTLVLERSFTYPHQVLETIVRERVTGLPLVPTISAILLQMDLTQYDFSHLRYVTNTAAALPTEHIVRLRQLLPHVRLYSMYGLTECKRVSYLPPDELDARPGSVGRGMPNEEVYIVDEHGQRVGPGVVGELVVRGANVMKGYWELPAETEQRLKPGPLPFERVLYTGDLFRTDDAGYLYFVGRKDDIIKSRGEKVSPREVENALYSHPGVAEAAVIGRPDPILGQSIQAIVVRKAGCTVTAGQLTQHCRGRLEPFMVPQTIEFRSSLPKSNNGKIDKRGLCGVDT
jgi:amino acid adenylation domain-containing protein